MHDAEDFYGEALARSKFSQLHLICAQSIATQRSSRPETRMGIQHKHRLKCIKFASICFTVLLGCAHAGYPCYDHSQKVAKAKCNYPGCSTVSCNNYTNATNSSLNCSNGVRSYFCAWTPPESSTVEDIDCSDQDCMEVEACVVVRDTRRTTAAPKAVREEVLSTTFMRTLEIHNGKTVWYSSANLGTKLCWGGSMSVWNIMTGGMPCTQNWVAISWQTVISATLALHLPTQRHHHHPRGTWRKCVV